MEGANPQVEKGHVRIANELWDEILRRDFSKRQQKLILFIWRLSYGTGQKDCEIKRFNQFEIVGLNKSDIKKEITYLRICKVLEWDESNMVFAINKNYKIWQVNPVKSWDEGGFKDLIHDNLSRKKVGKTPTGESNGVGKIPTKTPSKVGKTPTKRLVKHQLTPALNPSGARRTASLKPLLKPSFKDIKREEEIRENPFKIYEENFGILRPILQESFIAWCEDLGDDVVIAGMKLAAQRGGQTFSYVEAIWRDWAQAGIKNVEDARNYVRQNDKRKTNVRQFPKRKAAGDIDWENI